MYSPRIPQCRFSYQRPRSTSQQIRIGALRAGRSKGRGDGLGEGPEQAEQAIHVIASPRTAILPPLAKVTDPCCHTTHPGFGWGPTGRNQGGVEPPIADGRMPDARAHAAVSFYPARTRAGGPLQRLPFLTNRKLAPERDPRREYHILTRSPGARFSPGRRRGSRPRVLKQTKALGDAKDLGRD